MGTRRMKNNILDFPPFSPSSKDLLEYGAWYEKTYFHPKVICLPSEYESFLTRHKLIYKIEKSNSKLRWVLTIDDGTCGWEQKGFYVKTLKGHTFEQALEDAQKKCPEILAYYYDEGSKYVSNDETFDSWFEDLK
jgi:hypothetical protein